jgi:hypothetical protein
MFRVRNRLRQSSKPVEIRTDGMESICPGGVEVWSTLYLLNDLLVADHGAGWLQGDGKGLQNKARYAIQELYG